MSKPLIQTTGRRKRAVARVRLRPGTGDITVNGRAGRGVLPIPTHRMILTEPLRLTEHRRGLRRRRHASTAAASSARPARCASASPGRSSSSTPSCARRSRRPASSPATRARRSQEVRPQEGPQGAAVLQALIRPTPVPASRRALRFGTDGVRGVADAELDPRARRCASGAPRPGCSAAAGLRRRPRHPRSGPALEAALAAGLAAEGAERRAARCRAHPGGRLLCAGRATCPAR